MKRILSTLLLCLTSSLYIHAQQTSYQNFENIYLDAESSTITSFIQDSQGLMWIGTIKGLYSYDGYTTHPHNSSEKGTDIQIHCGFSDGKSLLYLGTDNGILVYNYQTDRYLPTIAIPSSVRAIAYAEGVLWIGSLNGFYRYDIAKKEIKRIDKQGKGLPNQIIYSLVHEGSKLYIGTYDGLCTYDIRTGAFLTITIPKDPSKSNVFVNSLLLDQQRACLWIGTEGTLYRYSLKKRTTEGAKGLGYNSIKSLALDHTKTLLVGTDNGLYTFNEQQGFKHIAHDSRVATSLSNNIIWAIYTDKDSNCWLGTDYGISLFRHNRTFDFVPISAIAGNGDGIRISELYSDSQCNIWLGGENGLLLKRNGGGSIWYKMGSSTFPLSHNRVRKIYEDTDKNLWIATDGSLNRFERAKQQFIHYTIVDKSRKHNANWCYDLFDDGRGRLWVASFLGGVFVVDKQSLLRSRGESIEALHNFNTQNGLIEDYISQIVSDRNGKVWVLYRNREVSLIDIKSWKIVRLDLSKELNNEKPNRLFCDSDGTIWVGFKGGVAKITNIEKRQVKISILDEFNPKEPLAMAQENNHLWISTTNSVWVLNRSTLGIEQCLRTSSHNFTSLYFDAGSKKMYMGGVDGYAITTLNQIKSTEKPSTIAITALYINNKAVQNLPKGDLSIRYADVIKVRYYENNLSFEFSDLEYSFDEKSSYVYKLEGQNNQWSTLKSDINRISYSNLSSGTYQLIICKLSSTGQPSEIVRQLKIVVLPPWYLTIAAKLLYLLLFVAVVIWVINFFLMKNRLKMERQEKERSLEQSKIKFDFFTNISHEIKTPLSLIIAPLAKLLYEVKEGEHKNQLRLAHQNAMKLNSLIHQALDFDKVENRSNPQLILSKIEFIEFSKSIFELFKESSAERKLTFSYHADCDQLYIDIDVVKMESILTNIISNAIKFTADGGRIELRISHSTANKTLDIAIIDNGVGISDQDKPHIFQRFFQAPSTKDTQEGTGIGLYLVKTYTELHGGSIQIESALSKGTQVTVAIPIKEYQSIASSSSSHDTNANAPLILIVEDNHDIAEVIVSTLGNSYSYLKATNGKAGLALALEQKPDLIITDLMMPVMDGLEMCRRLRNNIPTATTPVILLTAKESPEVEKESILLNIDSYIIKPYDPEMLTLKVEKIIQKSKKIEEKARLDVISTPKVENITSANEKFLSDIIDIIESNISNSDFNVNELSTLSGISPKQLYRRIKQLTGYSPVDYIKSIRMKKAAMLLEQKKFTVAEVMYMVGFSNHSYFSKCFQSFFGKTPRSYLEDSSS